VDFSFYFGGFSFFDDGYKNAIEGIELQNPQKHLKSIKAQESPKNFQDYSCNKFISAEVELNINEKQLDLIKFFRIYRDNQWLFNTRLPKFRVENLEMLQKQFPLKIQIFLTNGSHAKIESIAPILIPLNEIEKLYPHQFPSQ